jgi:hypothetical protein
LTEKDAIVNAMRTIADRLAASRCPDGSAYYACGALDTLANRLERLDLDGLSEADVERHFTD